jgi:hypothetical protein
VFHPFHNFFCMRFLSLNCTFASLAQCSQTWNLRVVSESIIISKKELVAVHKSTTRPQKLCA